MTELAGAFIWFTIGFLAIAPGIVGFFVPRWWWPAAWPVVGMGIIGLSLAVSTGVLPEPSPGSSDGTSWFGAMLVYLGAGGVGIVTALTVVAIRKVYR